MKLRCLVGAYAGEVLEYPDEVGETLLETGRAERVEPEPESVERAEKPAPERRPQRRKRKRGK